MKNQVKTNLNNYQATSLTDKVLNDAKQFRKTREEYMKNELSHPAIGELALDVLQLKCFMEGLTDLAHSNFVKLIKIQDAVYDSHLNSMKGLLTEQEVDSIRIIQGRIQDALIHICQNKEFITRKQFELEKYVDEVAEVEATIIN